MESLLVGFLDGFVGELGEYLGDGGRRGLTPGKANALVNKLSIDGLQQERGDVQGVLSVQDRYVNLSAVVVVRYAGRGGALLDPGDADETVVRLDDHRRDDVLLVVRDRLEKLLMAVILAIGLDGILVAKLFGRCDQCYGMVIGIVCEPDGEHSLLNRIHKHIFNLAWQNRQQRAAAWDHCGAICMGRVLESGLIELVAEA